MGHDETHGDGRIDDEHTPATDQTPNTSAPTATGQRHSGRSPETRSTCSPARSRACTSRATWRRLPTGSPRWSTTPPEDTTATARVQWALEHLDNRPTDSRVDEGRSDRLRRRRSQRAQSDAEQEPSAGGGGDAESDASAGGSNTSGPSERSKLSEPSDPDDPDETAEGGGVKSEQVGTYMYLPKDQKKELERLYNVLKAEYEYAYDADFEKNRHYYPLVVQYGVESLDGLDASEIREHLDAMSLAS